MFSKTFSLGKWFGVAINIDLSWFIIFLLVTWSLAIGFFPDTYPELGLKVNLILGLITSCLFFLSVLIHELSHSLVARSQGLPVKKITLFLFGGAAQLEEEPQNPKVELKVTLVGPLSSIVLATVFWSLKVWCRQLDLGLAPIAVFSTLASTNFVLALFNLLPGFPLDGGRILRAGLWQVTGDFRRATHWAATGGHVVATLILLVGIIQLFTTQFGGGLWLIILGLFLDQAVTASERESLFLTSLANVKVSSVMLPDPPSVPATTSIQDLINHYLLPSRRRCLPVTDAAGKPIGQIGIENLKEAGKIDTAQVRATDLMVPLKKDHQISPHARITTLLRRLRSVRPCALLVFEDNQLVGILTEEDLGAYLTLTDLNKNQK